MRRSLVAALASCADRPLKPEARRFLAGLSSDELQFIAEYLGACILEAGEPCRCSRARIVEQLARRLSAGEAARSEDRDHKLILLFEFLCRSGVQRAATA